MKIELLHAKKFSEIEFDEICKGILKYVEIEISKILDNDINSVISEKELIIDYFISKGFIKKERKRI